MGLYRISDVLHISEGGFRDASHRSSISAGSGGAEGCYSLLPAYEAQAAASLSPRSCLPKPGACIEAWQTDLSLFPSQGWDVDATGARVAGTSKAKEMQKAANEIVAKARPRKQFVMYQ